MSAMRIVDKVTIPEEPPRGSLIGFNMTILVALKSGSRKGKCRILLKMRGPRNKTEIHGMTEGILEGGEHGLQIRIPVALRYEGPDLYWYDVYVDDEIRTSIPLRLVVKPPESDKKPRARK
jgi:hypothetical protein